MVIINGRIDDILNVLREPMIERIPNHPSIRILHVIVPAHVDNLVGSDVVADVHNEPVNEIALPKDVETVEDEKSYDERLAFEIERHGFVRREEIRSS